MNNLSLIGMCAGMLARSISVAAIHEDSEKQQTALSIQRAASFLLRIAKS